VQKVADHAAVSVDHNTRRLTSRHREHAGNDARRVGVGAGCDVEQPQDHPGVGLGRGADPRTGRWWGAAERLRGSPCSDVRSCSRLYPTRCRSNNRQAGWWRSLARL
jgi:hypothetical protein